MDDVPHRRSALSMTAEDHAAIRSTPPAILLENPGKTLLELLSDSDIQERMDESVATVTECHKTAQSGGGLALRMLEVARDTYLIPDIDYLREQGRLPENLKDFDPHVAFAL